MKRKRIYYYHYLKSIKKAIKKECSYCRFWLPETLARKKEERLCKQIDCPLLGFGFLSWNQIYFTPLKGVREFCILCQGYNKENVQNCFDKDCHFYPFRMGFYVERKVNDE